MSYLFQFESESQLLINLRESFCLGVYEWPLYWFLLILYVFISYCDIKYYEVILEADIQKLIFLERELQNYDNLSDYLIWNDLVDLEPELFWVRWQKKTMNEHIFRATSSRWMNSDLQIRTIELGVCECWCKFKLILPALMYYLFSLCRTIRVFW